MLNVSVADILKILGEWTESSKFVDEVAKRLKVSGRQAYRIIKKDKQILKLVLPDRTVLYGLAEFGLPKSSESAPEVLTSLIEKGLLTKQDLESISTDDFLLTHPELFGGLSPKVRTLTLSMLKLIKELDFQKFQSLRTIKESLE